MSDKVLVDVADAILLLRGHGAVTTGCDMEQSRLNWVALAAFGPDYKGIPDESMDEFAVGQAAMSQAPHLARPLANMPPIPMGGVWKYYTELVSKDL